MLNEFYDFIANRIFRFFQVQSSKGILQQSESFCLKLDDEQMVKKVDFALEQLLDRNHAKGNYAFQCMDGSIYTTYTIVAKNTEIIIASQDSNITSDFLGATLRNAANESKKPLLMITANPIDSALSGSRNMASTGMPFNADILIREIKELVSDSSKLSHVEKAIMDYEIERREEDVFSDKTSLYEYSELLAIMSSGKIDRSIFPGFRLFYIDGKKDFLNLKQSDLRKEIIKNHELFEKIDRSVRFGNLENDLASDFDERFIKKIKSEKKDNSEQWSIDIDYSQVIGAIEKLQSKKEKPLQIDRGNIIAYKDLELDPFLPDYELFVRNEGSQTKRIRTKSILLFNSNNYPEITFKIDCNIRIADKSIFSSDSFQRDKNSFIFKIKREPISFHRFTIKDDTNKITYILKLCIISLPSEYLMPTVKTSFIVDYKSKGKSRLKLLDIGSDLSFNQRGKMRFRTNLKITEIIHVTIKLD